MTDYINQLAQTIASENLKESSRRGLSTDDIVQLVRDETKNIAEDWDKSRFLQRILELNERYLDEHIPRCKEPFHCQRHKRSERVHHDLMQDLKRIGQHPADSDTFSKQEANEADKRIDDVLELLKNLKTETSAAHEVLFEEIQSLKSKHYLGKKTWLEVLKGKLFDVVATEVLTENAAKPLIEAVTKPLGQLLLDNS